MGTAEDVKNAVRDELVKPETLAMIGGVERIILEVAKVGIEAALPGWTRPILTGLLGGFVEHEIDSLVSLTDKLLKGALHVDLPGLGRVQLALSTEKPSIPASEADTAEIRGAQDSSGDFPGPRED